MFVPPRFPVGLSLLFKTSYLLPIRLRAFKVCTGIDMTLSFTIYHEIFNNIFQNFAEIDFYARIITQAKLLSFVGCNTDLWSLLVASVTEEICIGCYISNQRNNNNHSAYIEICAILGSDTAYNGSPFPTFQENLSAS